MSDLGPWLFVGIDPGANGGLAVLPYQGRGDRQPGLAYPLPPSPEALLDLVLSSCTIPPGYNGLTVYMEKVGGYIQAGRGKGGEDGQPGSSMFNFGVSYGKLIMAVVAATGISPREVTPQEWQAALGVVPRKRHKVGRKTVWDETQSQFKNRLKELARPLLPPEDRLTLAKTDALLIAEYARRRHSPSPR